MYISRIKEVYILLKPWKWVHVTIWFYRFTDVEGWQLKKVLMNIYIHVSVHVHHYMYFYGLTYIAGAYWLRHWTLGRAVYNEVTGSKRRQFVRIPPVQE